MVRKTKTTKQTKAAVTKKGKAAQRRRKLLLCLRGDKRILVIAPHGVMGDDNYTDIIAERLHENLGCFAVVNEGFRRPDEDRGETSDPKNFLVDLGRTSEAEQLRRPHKGIPHDEDFLGWIDLFLAEIAMNHGIPFVVHIHGIDTGNIKKVASISSYKKKADDLHVLVGYGERKGKKQKSLTASRKTVKDLIKNLIVEKMNAIEAPVTISPNGKRYCGSDPDVLNQYLRNNGIKGQSIQLEIRELGFRDDIETALKTADSLANAIGLLVGLASTRRKEEATKKVEAPTRSANEAAPPAWAEVRTTLSEKSEERRIKVQEIDQQDTKFKSRVSEYGIDQGKFNDLMSSIASEGILNNIIVRKRSRKDKYQLISGFRRLAALENVYEVQGRKDELPEVEVPARVFSSLTDEEALRISFSENLARKDLTLWEMANYCRMIAEELSKQGKSQGDIEAHLAALINRDDRTVRRYLALSSIKNEEIRRDLHNGTIDASIGAVFSRQGLTDKDRHGLHRIYKRSPLPFRAFDMLAANVLRLKEWSGIEVKKILTIPTAKEFLSIKPDTLQERAEYLSKTMNKPLEYILAHEMANLKNSIEKVKSKAELAPFTEKFSEKASAIETRISKAIKAKKMLGKVAISPIGDLRDRIIKLTVAAPVSDLQKALQFTLKELKDDIASLENLFKKPPKPRRTMEEVKAKKRVKIDENASIAFAIKLKDLQDALRILIKDGTPTADLTGQVLIRATSDDKVQFGRLNHNRLLIDKGAEVHRQGVASLLLKDIYAPIIKSKDREDTECEVTGIDVPSEGPEKKGTLSVKMKSANFKMDIPTRSPDELLKLVDGRPPAAASIEVDASDLRDSLSKVLGCISPREIRKAITGVLVKTNRNQLIIVGTNGVMLNEVVKPHNGRAGREIEWIMAYQTGKLLKDVLAKQSGTVGISVSKNSMYFKLGDLLLIGRLITSERYPDYASKFKPADKSFRIPISKLGDMARSISMIANPEDNCRMTINADNSHVVFKNEKGTADCHSDSVKGKIDLDVNSEYLAELAKTLDGDNVEVRHITGTNYITFHPDEDNQRALLTIVKRR